MTTIPEPILKIGYNLLFTVGFALSWPYFTYLIWRRQPFWDRLGERLGHYPKELKEWLKDPRQPVWIHAVSVGEMLLARVLVRELRAKRPDLRILLTTGTPTGRKVGEPLLDANTRLVYVPTDFYYSMLRAFRRINPSVLILVENEIWPNMLWRARKMGVKILLVNSRLSRRNRRLFRTARTFVRPVLQLFDWIGVQSPEDMRRFAIAGFPEERLHLMGSMKYDVAALAADHPGKGGELRRSAGWDRGQVILLGGSTHPGEEGILADVVQGLKRSHPQLRLMLVPRHVERTDSVLSELGGTGLRVVRRSRLEQEGQTDPDILLVDTTGELRDLYPTADLVFIGKTLTGTGGQNFLEAARHGRAIVAGPHMENFMPLRREFEEKRAILIVGSAEELRAELDRLLSTAKEREGLGQRAADCFREHLGAGARCAEVLLETISLAEKRGWGGAVRRWGWRWGVGVGLGLGLGCVGGWAGESVMESGPERVAMVELFTSEGCKSCPVAEEWLSRLKEREDLWTKFVPVAWHVDSWDSLGWKDRWSSPRFSQRQWNYAKGWGKDSVETPGFVLHGREWAKVEEKSLLEVGPIAGNLRVKVMGNRVEVIWMPAGQTSKPQRAFLAPLQSGIESEVTAGENTGRRLSHDFVAREIVGVELKETDGVWRGGGTVKVPGDALAVWIKREGEVEPLQAVGGWIR